MEQPVLRPRPMPGDRVGPQHPPGRALPGDDTPKRPRRLLPALLGTAAGLVLLLSGVGLGVLGVTLAGGGGLAGLTQQAGLSPAAGAPAPSAPAPRQAPAAPVAARLGVEVADDSGPGALVVGVHVPGPGSAAGLEQGDLLLAFGSTRVDSAADLARAVARARPGDEVTLTVRHPGGGYRQLTAVPGLLT
ncbi:PDZ domain-containing protein [Streptomyces sp. NPDC102347]|uniref:PDZ domain-containing protein n=1 Tax=Streptomyces sp. NPDC102347 TaxID=3366157 RepID=UPI00380444BE